MKAQISLAILTLIGLFIVACEPMPIPTATNLSPTPESTRAAATQTATVTAIPSATPIPPTATPLPPKVLRIGHVGYPEMLDPQKASSSADLEVLRLAYEGLVGVDEKGNVIPGAAERWEFSSQGNTMTFHLRAGLKRTDGTPITARDYEYSLKRAIDPRLSNRPFAPLLFDVKGAVDLDGLDPKKVKADVVDKAVATLGVKVVDDSTLAVTFDNPITFWGYIASLPTTYPTDKRQVDRDPEGWSTRPDGHAGNGPFQIKSMEQGRRIVLVPNENYWRGKPRLDRIELIYYPDTRTLLDAFDKNEVDVDGSIAAEDLARINGDAKLKGQLVRGPGSITTGFAFNLAKKPFNDVNVRRAFSAALDRETFVREISKGIGKPYTRWIPPGVPGAQGDKAGVPGFDPKAAIKYLIDNGYAAKDSTADKPKVDCAKLGDIRLTYPSTAVGHKRFQFLAGLYVSTFNCPIVLEPVDPTNFAALIKDSKSMPQISYQSWMGDYAHPQNWLSMYWTCGTYGERYGYCNKDFDALVQKADQEPDSAKSLQIYQQAEDLMLKDVPSMFVSYSENFSLVQPYISGPQDHTGPADLQWAGQWGPVWTYDIDFAKIPAAYAAR